MSRAVPLVVPRVMVSGSKLHKGPTSRFWQNAWRGASPSPQMKATAPRQRSSAAAGLSQHCSVRSAEPSIIVPPPGEVTVGGAAAVPIVFRCDVHADLVTLEVDVRPEECQRCDQQNEHATAGGRTIAQGEHQYGHRRHTQQEGRRGREQRRQNLIPRIYIGVVKDGDEPKQPYADRDQEVCEQRRRQEGGPCKPAQARPNGGVVEDGHGEINCSAFNGRHRGRPTFRSPTARCGKKRRFAGRLCCIRRVADDGCDSFVIEPNRNPSRRDKYGYSVSHDHRSGMIHCKASSSEKFDSERVEGRPSDQRVQKALEVLRSHISIVAEHRRPASSGIADRSDPLASDSSCAPGAAYAGTARAAVR